MTDSSSDQMSGRRAGPARGTDLVSAHDLALIGLEPLLSPHLAPLFAPPTRLNVDSAWYGHIPFAHWVVTAARPRVLVELGTHAGVSYSAFCEAVLRARLDTRCFAVDTWRGDEHSGFYDDTVFNDLKSFHAARYSAFSRLLRCTFDEALPFIADESIDLLHIDGRHHYDDVRHDFETWRAKLSSRAVVLFHDTNVRERDFGVWRLWTEVSQGAPGFEFFHGYGLGVLAVGRDAPAPIRALCTLDDELMAGVLRERFAALGERWVREVEVHASAAAAASTAAAAVKLQQDAEGMHQQLLQLIPRAHQVSGLRAELSAARLDRLEAERLAHTARLDLETARRENADLVHRLQQTTDLALEQHHLADSFKQELEAARREDAELLRRLRHGIEWPLVKRVLLRVAKKVARRVIGRPQVPPPVAPTPAPMTAAVSEPDIAPARAPRRPRVLFASGEAHTPGNVYRCERLAALAEQIGWDAAWRPVDEVGVPPLIGVDLVVLWRVQFSEHVKGVIDFAHSQGARVAFDIDDLVFKPDFATQEMLDSVRIGTYSENGALALFRRFRDTLDACDLALCTTDEIACYLRLTQKPTWVVPNGFDAESERAARLARRAANLAGGDGLVRIGYAAGSRTHQKDFAEAADAIAAVLRARPQARLVLFHEPGVRRGVVLTQEFPALAACAGQIENRPIVPLAGLPAELARFDINIAPLEAANPFCAAKSELKYFEAALADVCTVASPSGAIGRAIRDGETGFLAGDPAQWEAILLRLIDDAGLRARVGRAAYHDVLWQFGPRRVSEQLAGFLRGSLGGPQAAAALECEIRRGPYRARDLPLLPEADTLFEVDQLRHADVTVTIASYNYSAYIIEALDSVRLQTLPVIDLVVVDDVSGDDSVEVALAWLALHAGRFNRVKVLRHRQNFGLGASRNSGFNAAETPYVLPLDSDNRLRPECCATLLEVMQRTRAAYAYPQLQHFGASDAISGGELFEPRRFIGGNFIDAMALVAKWAWAASGGYYQDRSALGWEDFDLWCSLAELGQWGEPVAQPLAEYRVHAASMVNAITETAHTKPKLVETLEQRHKWLLVTGRTPYRR